MYKRQLFTDREKSFGNRVKFYPHELIFMSTEQKLQLFENLVDSASCYKNELRTAFGMMPLPELVGQLAMSSNKTNAENNKAEKDGSKNNNEPPGDGGGNSDDDDLGDGGVGDDEE